MTRRVWTRVGGLMVAGLLCAAGAPVTAKDAPMPTDPLARLRAGNARFVANPETPLPIDAVRRAVAAATQAPLAMVLSCADARVPPEIIFQTGLGELYVVRASGHVPDRAILASLEYGAGDLHVPLLVVMGHESCDAVKVALDTPVSSPRGPNLDYLIGAIRPAVGRAATTPGDLRLRAAILANVEETVNDVIEESAVLRERVRQGTLMVVGAYYELTTGRVHFSEPVQPPPGVH